MLDKKTGGLEIPQCLKKCQSIQDCDPRDRCDLFFGGGACLPKDCPKLIDFGILKQTIKFVDNGSELIEHTLICHAEYIIQNRYENKAYRIHPVECKFNITGNNHVKWILRSTDLGPSKYGLTPNPHNYVEAICERGKYFLHGNSIWSCL